MFESSLKWMTLTAQQSRGFTASWVNASKTDTSKWGGNLWFLQNCERFREQLGAMEKLTEALNAELQICGLSQNKRCCKCYKSVFTLNAKEFIFILFNFEMTTDYFGFSPASC